MADEEDRKSHTIWLKPRHQKMLQEMPGVVLADVVRRTIEDLFEGRHAREHAHFCIESDLTDLSLQWERVLGLTVSNTVTATEDGFRVVLVAMRDYNDEQSKRPPAPLPDAADDFEEFDDLED